VIDSPCLSAVDGYELPRQIHKARVHAFLATLEPPDHRLGTASQDGLFTYAGDGFDRFRALLP
jgi:hypothetical protein